MKNKKAIWMILGALLPLCLMLAFLFKPMTMKDLNRKPDFTGVVIEVFDKTITVLVDAGEDELKSSDKMSVSLDAKLKESITHFYVGDQVRVFYDGVIAESYPAQINTVYAIFLISSR